MKTQYISEDNKTFDNALDCARHEITSIPIILEKINQEVSHKPQSHQGRWCGGGACACMGCINSKFYKMGLTKEHWQVWNSEFRVIPEDALMDDSETDVVLKEVGDNKKAVIKAIRQLTGLGMLEANNLTQPHSVIKTAIDHFDSKVCKKALEEAGATVDIRHHRPKMKF